MNHLEFAAYLNRIASTGDLNTMRTIGLAVVAAERAASATLYSRTLKSPYAEGQKEIAIRAFEELRGHLSQLGGQD